MSVRYGLDAKLYYDVAGVAHNTWTEFDKAREVTLALEKGEIDVTTRANAGWEATAGKLKKASIEFQMPSDPADAGYLAFENCYHSGAVIGIACMDGSIIVAGNKGLKADMKVLKFERAEPLDGVQMISVTLKPTYSATAPSWYTVPA